MSNKKCIVHYFVHHSVYNTLRPSQILRSEKQVASIIKVLEEDYINPFGVDIDKTLLYNLSSGHPVEPEKVADILNIKEKGSELMSSFVNERLLSKKKLFHDTLTRVKTGLFKNTTKTIVLTKDKKISCGSQPKYIRETNFLLF